MKLVDGEGSVLGERYEGACEALCNATTAKELHDALDTFEEAIVEDQGNNVAEVKEEEEEKDGDSDDERRFWNRRRSCCIFLAATRKGARLVEKAKEGAKVLGNNRVEIRDRGVVTTPIDVTLFRVMGKRWKNSLQKKKEKEEDKCVRT